jgi:hypothetical protein
MLPKPGFKSITVSEHVYKRFLHVYEKKKKSLELKGITSFSGYITSTMEEVMAKHETFSKYAPLLEALTIESDRVILKDNKQNRIIEVMVRNGELYCLLDERSDCVHVGFAYSIPEVYSAINNKGKAPNLQQG